MNFAVQIGITAYLFLIVPFLLGILEAAIFRKEKKDAAAIFVNGYLLMMALFWLIAVVMIRMEMALSVLAKVYLFMTLVLSVAGVLLGRKVLKECVDKVRDFWLNTGRKEAQENAGKNGKILLFVVCALTMVCSIAFTKPDSADETVEIVATAVHTDTMYLYDAYTGYQTGYVEAEQALSPVEMLYAAGASLSGASADVLVYYMLPVSILLFFFLAMWQLGGVLFKQEEQRILFEKIMILIYWMTVFVPKSSLVTGIFVNGWNGLTLLSCVLLPLTLGYILECLNQIQSGCKKIGAKLEKLYTAVVLLLAGQLTYDRGGFYIACMLFLGVAVILVKGGYDYGITSGRIKKHI